MLQVGVTAMLIASKYEEIWAPELHDFVYISDRAYKKDQILGMEKVMLNSLKFNLTGAPQSPPLSKRRQNPGMLRMFCADLVVGVSRYSRAQVSSDCLTLQIPNQRTCSTCFKELLFWEKDFRVCTDFILAQVDLCRISQCRRPTIFWRASSRRRAPAGTRRCCCTPATSRSLPCQTTPC